MSDHPVYVFNITSQAIGAFAPNGLTAGAIDNWSGGETPFVPAQLAVPTVDDPNQAPGNFLVNANNKVLFKTRSGDNYNFELDVPQVEEGMSLILYVSLSDWVLYNSEGFVWNMGPVRPGAAFGLSL